jgi:outer membrane lipoprotein SlyB
MMRDHTGSGRNASDHRLHICYRAEALMKAAAKILCLMMPLTISGCAGEQYGQRETSGAIGGGVLGGFAGSLIGSGTGQLVSAGIGTLIGALLGSEVGKSLAPSDKLYHPQAAIEKDADLHGSD